MKPKRMTIAVALAVIAALALSAVGAVASASAAGPVWLVKGAELGAGAKETFVSTSQTEFKLSGINNVLCKTEKDTGELIGGNPGTDLSTIEFKECAVEGRTVEECGASNGAKAGVVTVEVKTVLVYPDPLVLTKALDAFTPDNNTRGSDLFVEFTLSGTNCPFGLQGLKVNVNATGTNIASPALNKKCGVLGELGKLNAGAFEPTAPGAELATGVINTEALKTEAELWKPAAAKFELITCKLEAFGFEASELGISAISLNSGNTFGWEV